MDRVATFTREKSMALGENSQSNLQNDAKNSNTEDAMKSKQMISEVGATSQLKDLIKESIKDQVDRVTQPSYIYAKPYSPRIDCLRMPENYQPPKF